MDPNVEPWIYPLFFLYASRGRLRNLMCLNNNRRVSRRTYINYKLAIRPNESNPIISGRRLPQQYIVDSYVKME